jgi:hypothetical protein
LFRRSKSDTETVTAEAAKAEGKGRPTPSRKEAEAARKAQLKGITDPKTAKKAARDADRQARYESRLALQAGDERRLPARDAGPVKAWVRDMVDRRRSAGELFIPVAVAVLVSGFIKIAWVQVAQLAIWSIMLVAVVVDSLYLVWKVRRVLPARFPNEEHRGAVMYAVIRSLQLRRLRLPPPKVKVGGDPVPPKKPKSA